MPRSLGKSFRALRSGKSGIVECLIRGLTTRQSAIIFNHMVKYQSTTLDATFGALADPTRRSILERLIGGESSVTSLADPFDMSLPAVSKHLRVLEKAGLLTQEKDGRVRRCRMDASPMKEAADWVGRYRIFWEEQLDSLAEYIERIQPEEKEKGGHLDGGKGNRNPYGPTGPAGL